MRSEQDGIRGAAIGQATVSLSNALPAKNMSHNTIRARVSFSFRGEVCELDSVIDLDRCLGKR